MLYEIVKIFRSVFFLNSKLSNLYIGLMKSGEALKVWQKRFGTGKRHMKKVNVTEKVFEGLSKKSFSSRTTFIFVCQGSFSVQHCYFVGLGALIGHLKKTIRDHSKKKEENKVFITQST